MGRSKKHDSDDDDSSEEEEEEVIDKNEELSDNDESDNEEKEKKKKKKKNKKKKKRRPKKKKRKHSDADEQQQEKEDSDDDDEEEALHDKNDIFAPRDVTDMPPPKKRKLTPEEKLGKRRKDLRRTIYVEGLPFTFTEEKVKEFFHKELEVEDDIIDVRLPRWQDSGRLRGYGHIVFNTIHIRDKALRTLNGKTIGTRYITIKEAHEPKNNTSTDDSKDKRFTKARAKPRAQPSNCRTIFIKNLPYEASESDIQNVFEKYGKVVEEGGVRLARNSRTRQSKGFGYVQFKNMEGANSAVEESFKSSITIGNRTVFVDYDDSGGKMKGSFRDEKGWLWKKKYASDK